MDQESDILADRFLLGDTERRVGKKEKRIKLYYFIGLVFGQISCLLMSLLCIRAFKVWYFLLICFSWIFIWSIFGQHKRYMGKLHFLFWLQVCAHLLMFVLALSLKKHNFIICGSGITIFLFICVQSCYFKSFYASPVFLLLYIWYSCLNYTSMRRLSYSSGLIPASPLILLLLLFCIVGWSMHKKLPLYSKFVRIQLTYLLYPLCFVAIVTLSSLINLNYINQFNYLTVGNHIVFIYIWKQFCKYGCSEKIELYPWRENQLSQWRKRNCHIEQNIKCCRCQKAEKIRFCYQRCYHLLRFCSNCIIRLVKEKKRCQCNTGLRILWIEKQGESYVVKGYSAASP